MATESSINYPSFLSRETRCKKLLTMLVCMLVCTLGLHTGVLAFAPGKHMPPGVPDLTHPNTRVEIVKQRSVANDMDQNIVKAHIVDSDGNPVNNVIVTFTLKNASGGGASPVSTTNASGDAFVYFTSDQVGKITVVVKVSGQPLIHGDLPTETFFDPGPPDLTLSTLTITANNAKANNSSANIVRAYITDAYGHPLVNENVEFEIVSGTATPAGGIFTIATSAGGTADFVLRSLVAGNVTVRAKVRGNYLPDIRIVRFVADVPSTSNPLTRLDVGVDNSIANNTAQNTVIATIVDANGNPVEGAIVKFTITGGTAVPGGSFVDADGEITTGPDGKATMPIRSSKIGTVIVTATVNGNAITTNSPVTVKFVADVPSTSNPNTFLTVVINGAKANNSAVDGVRVQVYDAWGNPVEGASIEFIIVSGIATFTTPATKTTGPDGRASITLRSPVADTVRIRAKVNGVDITIGNPVKVWFVADDPSTTNPGTRLEKGDDLRIANNTAQNTVLAYLVDANGNVVVGKEVQFTITGGTAMSGATFDDLGNDGRVNTVAGGIAVLPIKSSKVGTVIVTATVNGQPITNGSPVTVTFVADVPSVTNPNTFLAVVVNNAKANNAALNGVRAQVYDAWGNPVEGATIEFIIVSGTATFTSPAIKTTGPDGRASITLKSPVAGPVQIKAKVNGIEITIGNPVEVIFIADDPSTTNPNTRLEKGDDFRVANNVAQNTVIAYIVDANGNPVVGKEVQFTLSGGTALSGASFDDVGNDGRVTTIAGGIAVLPIKSNKIGTVTVTATINGQPITFGSPVTITFTVDAPSVTNPGTRLVIDQNDAIANGTDQNIVTAWVVDANGNPVQDAFVVFTLAGAADFASVPAGLTDANGKITLLLTSLVAGLNDVNATVNGQTITNGAPAKVRFIADAPSTSNPATTITVGDNMRVADNTAKNTVVVHVVDANGNPVQGASVNFTMTGGTAMASATFDLTGPLLTDVNGDAIMPIRSSAVGTVSITATVNGSPVLNGDIPATVTFVADAPSTSNPATTLSVEVTGAIANGTDLNKVKARIVDANGNPVAGATIDFAISGAGIATFDGPNTGLTTDANGEVIISLKSTVAGLVDIIATVNGTPIVNGSPATVEFVADAPNTGHALTALIVVVPEAAANGTATTSVKAHIVDVNGNPVKGASVNFAIANGTATIVESNPIVTDANGDAIITLVSTVIGEVEVVADVNGSTITNGSPAKVRFVAGDPAVGHPATALIVVIPTALADGTAVTSVQAHVVDANGHIVPNVNVEFTIAAGTATIVEGTTVATNSNGDAVITLHSTVAGEVSITATINGVAIVNGSPAKVRFTAGNPDPAHTATALIVVVDRATANGVATNSVKAHIVDTYGNPVPGATVEFTIANGTATIIETNPIITDANGDAIITLTSTVGGTVDITATVNTSPIVNGSPATVTFTTDPDITHPDTRLIVVANDAIADGVETNSVKAHVVDATGTPLHLKEVFFKIESGDATVLTVQPVLTDVNGDATILLASKTAGSVTVTAKVGDKPIVHGSPAKLRFVPIDIYVPKVFTPNNDGQNDVAKPIVVGLTTFHYFNIYNRWGNLVFTTKDPNVGWDGRFKGVLQPVETYLWIAEGLDKDKKKITRRGMISLVR
jgi:adhesin/invasin